MKPLSYQTVIAAVTRLLRAQRSFAWRCAALLVLALGLASL